MMKREDFVKVVEETLDSRPEEFRSRILNVAILVEDFPANQSTPQPGQKKRLLLGIFHGVPATKRSVFNLPTGPDHIVLYQKTLRRSAQARLKCVIKLGSRSSRSGTLPTTTDS
jgi:predicted Zn-dependent protease with MMP-like domain